MAQDKSQISVKLSPELKQHLKVYKNSRGKRSLKAAVVEILENYFRPTQLPNQPQPIDSSIGRIASLEAKVTYLSEQVEALKQAIAAQQPSESAPSIVDAAPTTLKPLVEPPTNSSSTKQAESETTTSTDDFDDDMYDEPDEILYNFLEP